MPSMADITVKKNDGVTDIVYTALTPSAGDSVPAQWRQNDATIPAHRPMVIARTQFNGPRDARKMLVSGKFPYTNGDGVVVATMPFSFEVTRPLIIPDAFGDEAVSQFTNILVSSLIKSMLKNGYAPT